MTVEWLGGAADDDADELPPPPPVDPRKRRALWIGGAVLVVALGVGVAVSQDGGSHRSATTRQSAQTTPAQITTAPSTASRTPSLSVPPPQSTAVPVAAGPHVTEVGHHILGATSNWELFARTDSSVIRIELEAGRIQTTQIPALASGGGIGFVVGPSSAILRPFDAVEGYRVPDGEPPKVLTGLLARSGGVYAGPTSSQVWIQPDSSNDSTPTPRLYDLAQDRPVGTAPSAPQQFGQPFMADGSGYLLYSGVGGVYDVRPDGVHRVTSGALAAVGAKAWLVQECDDNFRCANVLVDKHSNERRTLGPALPSFNYQPGSISPNGRYAVYVTVAAGGNQPQIHIVDLQVGSDAAVDLAPSDLGYGLNPFVWDPDHGNLLLVDDRQAIRVVDPATGKIGSLGIQLPPVDQIALRPATG